MLYIQWSREISSPSRNNISIDSRSFRCSGNNVEVKTTKEAGVIQTVPDILISTVDFKCRIHADVTNYMQQRWLSVSLTKKLAKIKHI